MQFLYPNVLFLLIFLVVLIFLSKTTKQNIEKIFAPEILNKLLVDNKSIGKTTRNILFIVTLALFIVALARPVMDMKEQKIKQKLIPIVVALDVSKSMKATDIYPSRIDLAKKKLKLIVKLAKNATIGVVLFAQNSYIVSPVTEDFTSLGYIVDNLDTSLNFANGSNIFAVLEATTQMLKDYNVKNLIILSDGGNDDEYKEELELAKENKITIYSVGLATKQGAPIPDEAGYLTDEKGNIVTVSLNESIKSLSLNSGGGYIDFSLSSGDISAILSQIQKESKKEEFDSKKIKTYTELFYYPLGFGIFCLFIAFSSLPRLKSKSIEVASLVFVIFVLIYPQSGVSGLLDFQKLENAKKSYEAKDYKNAIKSYKQIKESDELNYNIGNSYYKNKQFKKALQSYGKISSKNDELNYKKLHNLGNSYVKTKELEKAKESYEKALKLKDDKQTRQNLEAVKKALEKSKKKKDQKNKQDKNKDNKNQKNKDGKKNKNSDKKNKKNKKQKNNKKDGKKEKDKKAKSSNSKLQKQKPISDMEEKKWLKSLQNKKIPIMLQKVKSSKPNNLNIDKPW